MHPLLPSIRSAALAALLSLSPLFSASAETGQPPELTIPGTGYALAANADTRSNALPEPALIDAVTVWLGREFKLEPASSHPDFAFASEDELATLWLDGLEMDMPSSNLAKVSRPEIVALYDKSTQTIFLPQGWSSASPVDLSVLVHEMVHHLQTSAKTVFPCPQQQEKLAYAAQDKWLKAFGTSLEAEFEVDAFTLLVRTQCVD